MVEWLWPCSPGEHGHNHSTILYILTLKFGIRTIIFYVYYNIEWIQGVGQIFIPAKIKGLGTDGANTMSDHIHGLFGLFKVLCTEIYHVHCLAH